MTRRIGRKHSVTSSTAISAPSRTWLPQFAKTWLSKVASRAAPDRRAGGCDPSVDYHHRQVGWRRLDPTADRDGGAGMTDLAPSAARPPP